jgi:hypothetical protein
MLLSVVRAVSSILGGEPLHCHKTAGDLVGHPWPCRSECTDEKVIVVQ